ncbi:MAG: hypothetical protein ABSF62_15645 [Bryobacteraceae bacterium]
MKFRIAIAVLLAAACFAQTTPPDAPKPPAGVDQALRARVNEFYGLLLKRDFRKAEALIAEDTKDYYYGIGKPDFTKFELLEIRYSDDFTHATAIVQCTQKVVQPGFPLSEWNLKIPSAWKLENGNWYWYVSQTEVMTPVGIVKKVEAGNGAGGSAPATDGGPPKVVPKPPDFAYGKVAADKNMVTLEENKAEKVTIVNGSTGEIRLSMPKQLGLDLQLEPAVLLAGEKAVLTVRALRDSVSGVVYVEVIPTGEIVAVKVEVK